MKSRDREMGLQSIDQVSPSDLTITSPVGDYIRPESLHVNAMYSIINGIGGGQCLESQDSCVIFMLLCQEVYLGQPR